MCPRLWKWVSNSIRARFRVYEYKPGRVAEQLRSVVHIGQNEKGTHCFFVAEDSQGQAVGGLIGCVEKHFFSEQLVATIIHYDVLPERRMSGAGLRLLAAFRKWAENRGAVELSAGVNSGVELKKWTGLCNGWGLSKPVVIIR